MSHGALCFFVRDTLPLNYYHDNHRGDGRVSLWFPGTPGLQDILVAPEGGRYFRPPTSASGTSKDWVGVYIDDSCEGRVDWIELATLIEDTYRRIAPRKLVAELAARRRPKRG